ncbi:MAG: GHKL domain-containing protein, partial [Oscillospiraceae bacterium]|nr:GHKL domain-containing protein [Oscillospiraceae bacterium]
VFLTPEELLEIDLKRTYYISRTLRQELRDEKYTLLNIANNRPAAVFIDGELIYTNCPEVKPKLDDTVFPEEFNSFEMRGENSYITLPENYAGRRLTVATEHYNFQSMPMVIMSSLTMGWYIHCADASSMFFPAVSFAVIAVILFGMWLYGVFCGIRNFSTLIVISAAMTQSLSYLRQYEIYSPVPTAMDTPFEVYVPLIAAALPLIYFLLKLEKKRYRIMYGIILGVTTVAAAAFQTAMMFDTPLVFGAVKNILVYISIAALIVFAMLEWKSRNIDLRIFLVGFAAVLISIAALYFGSLAGEGYHAGNIRYVLSEAFNGYYYDIINFLGMALFVLSAIVSFYSLMVRTARIQTDLAVQNERLEQLDRDLAVQKQFYEAKLTSEKEIRSLKHDIYGHLSTLSLLLNDNKSEEAASYLAEVVKLHGERKSEPLCGDPYMNAALTEYSARCEENDISFVCHVGVDGHKLPATELCLILNNALENAVEACLKLPKGERKIKVQAAVKQNRFLLRVSNSFNGVIREKSGLPVTEKAGKEHGYGLLNIQRAVQRKGGSMTHLPKTGILCWTWSSR